MRIRIREFHAHTQTTSHYYGELQKPADNLQDHLIMVEMDREYTTTNGEKKFDPPKLMGFNPGAVTFQSIEYDIVD